LDQGVKTVTYAFKSKVWNKLFSRQQQYNLHRNFRQEDDHFRKLLERIRRGTLDKRDHKLLKSLNRELELEEGIKPVHLYVLIRPFKLIADCPGSWT
jgi:replication initiation and membrane attachment protein DnaB